MKINRQSIYAKYGGRCAYCGREIPIERMQVDHLWPRHLAQFRPNEDNNAFANLMPACQPCNIHKHRFTMEQWRAELQAQVSRLRKNAQFNRALRFDQVKLTETPIWFYFEGYPF
jgi:5-methylcytosine-specific restriction endonuclease McrA